MHSYLDGARHYHLTITPDVPAKDFWSVVVYDPQTRSELQTGDHPGNWIQTVSGKNWFAILRLYGPLEPWFDKTWIPGDIESLDAD